MVNITHVRSSHLPPLLPNLYLLTFEILNKATNPTFWLNNVFSTTGIAFSN